MLTQDGKPSRYLELNAELAQSLQQHTLNRQRITNKFVDIAHNQQQVSLQDLTADDLQSLLNLARGNIPEEVDPHLQAAAQAVIQQHFAYMQAQTQG